VWVVQVHIAFLVIMISLLGVLRIKRREEWSGEEEVGEKDILTSAVCIHFGYVHNRNLCCIPHWNFAKAIYYLSVWVDPLSGQLKNLREGLAQWFMPVISATKEMEIRKITIWGQPKQKSYRNPISINELSTEYTCHISYMGSLSRAIVVQVGLGKKQKTLSEK
jgi:hypothetical protein